MPIRLSGMVSGLDTEALVKELVSAYSKKSESSEKEKTKIEWKQEAWEEINTEVNSFFKGSLSNMRLSGSYTKQAVEVSDTTKASVSASGNAVLGVQTLNVLSVAKAGYLTGAKLNASGSGTKLSELGFSSRGSLTIAVGDKSYDFEVTGDTSISNFLDEVRKVTGVNASYDTANKRIFISSNEPGKENDFSLTANDAGGNKALYALGLSTEGSIDTSANTQWLEQTTGNEAGLTTTDSSGKTILDESAVKAYIKENIADSMYALIEASKTYQTNKSNNTDVVTWYEANLEQIEAWNESHDPATDPYTDEDGISYSAEQYAEAKSWLEDEANAENTALAELKADYGDYMAISGLGEDEMDSISSVDDVTNAIYAKTKSVYELQNSYQYNTGDNAAVRISGSDAEILLNGASYTSSSNTFVVNGLTVVAKGVTGEGQQNQLTITTSTDSDGIYDSIKSMFSTYNTLVSKFSTLYNADSARDYSPLTSEEKEEMSDEEVEKWEKKIKDALLKNDSSLSSLMSTFSSAMSKSYYILDGMAATYNDKKEGYTYNGELIEYNGKVVKSESQLKAWANSVGAKSYALSDFGCGTLSYFTAAENEKYNLHINGDPDDGDTSDQTDKLKTAISADPNTVAAFFSALANGLYKNLDNRMTSTDLNSKYKVYNDKELTKEKSEIESTISDWNDKLKNLEDYWYDKFAAMEKALSKLESQSSSLTGLIGS